MTDCSEQLTFSFHPSKQVTADFQGGEISSDAGLLPIGELDARLGWTARIAEVLADGREARKVDHTMPTLVHTSPYAAIASAIETQSGWATGRPGAVTPCVEITRATRY